MKGARQPLTGTEIGAHGANQAARISEINDNTLPPGGLLSNHEKMNTCKATRTDGEPCRAPAQAEKDYCFFHDPDREEDRIMASRNGGLARRRRPVSIPTAEELDPEEARAILAGLIEATINGALDPATARTVGYLLQIEAKIREGYNLEKRIEAIEETIKREKEAAKI